MSGIQERITAIARHLVPNGKATGRDALTAEHPDDVVITYAKRTALTKARKGALKDTVIDDLMIALLKAVRENSKLDPAVVEDICCGNVLHPGASYVTRAAVLAAGFPVTTASSVASRWCSSGLLATQQIANQIISGSIECGIAIGVESMSQNPDKGGPKLSEQAMENKLARDTTMPMGWTSENVAGDFDISRDKQDRFAARSQQKAERAQNSGWFDEEIIPITVTWTDPKTGESTKVVADKDDGVRSGTTAEGLAKIKPAFPKWNPGTTTGGNASQITDGAAAILMMKRSVALKHGQAILGKFIGATVTGLEPRIMGIGPAIAIPKLFQKFQLTEDDIDIFEINEAFASQIVYCQQKLGIEDDKLNPRGGAIALGHPLGCTGARQIVTALAELKRTKKRTAVISMCVGTGIGMAGLIVSEQQA